METYEQNHINKLHNIAEQIDDFWGLKSLACCYAYNRALGFQERLGERLGSDHPRVVAAGDAVEEARVAFMACGAECSPLSKLLLQCECISGRALGNKIGGHDVYTAEVFSARLALSALEEINQWAFAQGQYTAEQALWEMREPKEAAE